MEIARGPGLRGRQCLSGYDQVQFAFAKVIPGPREIESRAGFFFKAKNAVVELPRTLEIRDQQAGVE